MRNNQNIAAMFTPAATLKFHNDWFQACDDVAVRFAAEIPAIR